MTDCLLFPAVGADETIAKAETTALQGGRAKDALCAVADDNTPSLRARRQWTMKIISTLLFVFVSLAVTTARAEPSLVIVVRHAERAAEPKGDPSLSAAGNQRAQLLADTLADAKPTAIITTQFRRTQETALPIAKKFGIEPTVIAIRRDALAAHIEAVVAAVRQLSGVVLVVGHSNTVAEIVAGLSAAKPMQLCETSFSNIFVVSPHAAGGAMLQFEYGQADPAPSVGCQ